MIRLRAVLCIATLLVVASPTYAIDIEGTTVVVPVAMHGPGAQGTQWQTDLCISNMTMAAKNVNVTFYPTNGEPVGTTVNVRSFGVVELRDVVLSTFGFTNAKGMLLLSVETTTGIQATARIFNAGNPMGEFGQFVPGIAMERLERQAYVAGLAGVDGNRSNFGIANPAEEPVEVSVYVVDGEGNALNNHELTVGGMSVVQINDLFAEFGITPQRGVQVDMHAATAVPIYGYASVVRNGTGDAIFIFGTSPNN